MTDKIEPYTNEELAYMDRRDRATKECSGMLFFTPINYDRFRETIRQRDAEIERLKEKIISLERDLSGWENGTL